MIYVTSDLHGYSFDKFKNLLDRAGFSDEDFLFILGDVIDRGDDGIEILKWLLLQPNAELILGNHEAMMLSCSFLADEISYESLESFNAEKMGMLADWQFNGAEQTISALAKTDNDTRKAIFDYLREAPLYEKVSVGEREYVLVHAGLGNFRDDKELSEYTAEELLWTRPYFDAEYSKKFMTVIGHTPTCTYGREYRGRIIKTDTWINIDTGASCDYAPMLLRLDDMQEFYIE